MIILILRVHITQVPKTRSRCPFPHFSNRQYCFCQTFVIIILIIIITILMLVPTFLFFFFFIFLLRSPSSYM